MQDKELFFVIPTYRLRDVGETIELYDAHFWRNDHSVRMLVFDDSSPVNQEKYYALLEDCPESLAEHEVCRGRLYKAGQNGYTRKSFDILASFLDVLGKPAAQVPANYERGELLVTLPQTWRPMRRRAWLVSTP